MEEIAHEENNFEKRVKELLIRVRSRTNKTLQTLAEERSNADEKKK